MYLGACRFSGPDVSHILGKLEDLIEVVGVDDRRHPTTTAGKVDRRVFVAHAVNDRRQLSARF